MAFGSDPTLVARRPRTCPFLGISISRRSRMARSTQTGIQLSPHSHDWWIHLPIRQWYAHQYTFRNIYISNWKCVCVYTALLSYRSFGCCRQIYKKLFHTVSFKNFSHHHLYIPIFVFLSLPKNKNEQVFHILAVPAIVMGFLTVLDSRNLNVPPITNFYSLHSWMGLTTMGLFAIQVARMVIEL